MAYIALFFAGVLFVISNSVVRFSKAPVAWVVVLSAVITFLMVVGGMFFSPLVFYYAVALAVLTVVAKRAQWRARTYCAASLLTLVGLGSYVSYAAWTRIEAYREQYPFVSLEARLPPVPLTREPVLLSAEAKQHLEAANRPYEDEERSWIRLQRSTALKDLHENATQLFVMSPGFGVARMLSPYYHLAPDRPDRRTKPFAVPFAPVSWSLGDVRERPPVKVASYELLVLGPLAEFVPPGSDGYVRSRREVAGFQPHGRNDYLRPAEERLDDFRILRLDLVSLLLHETPVAYDTQTLPSMEEIKDLKTRSLDAFEQYGLANLRSGEDLFARQDGWRLRLIGALRNAKACSKCHSGEVGELLGAFSYTLEKK